MLSSGLFDPLFYGNCYPDVAESGVDPVDHYLSVGASEGRRPHLLYDGAWYRAANPDIGQANPLLHYLRNGRAEGRTIQKHAVVYTAIMGGFDRLRRPTHPDPDLDYVVFSETPREGVPEPWICVPDTRWFGNARRTSRYFKTHPHRVLPGYELSVWIDSAFQIRNLKAESLEPLLGSADIAFFRHPWRDCAYAEAAEVMKCKMDASESIDWTIKQLAANSYPRNAGLVEAGVIIRRHGVARLEQAMEQWWQMILNGSQRDQTSINFVLWKEQVQHGIIPGFSRRNEWVYWMGHQPTTWDEVERLSNFYEREILELQGAIEKAQK